MLKSKIQFKKGLFKALFLFQVVTLVGCAGTPPLVEQARAIEAGKYAKQNYAAKYASSFYIKGSAYLKKAHEYFENRVYEKAKNAYIVSMRYFEKAENKARISQIKKGGEF